MTQRYENKAAPHIIFFLVDDWGYNDCGYQSSWLNWTTPNIDKLMQAGVRFTHYYTHELCGPSRAALLTGRYAARFGMNGDTQDIVELPHSEFTLGQEMQSAGYRTNLIGKWHMGYSNWEQTPTFRGFDYFYGYYGGEIDYWTKFNGPWLDLHEMEYVVNDTHALDITTHSAYLYEQKAEEVISKHAVNYPNTPMFLYYASQLIHTSPSGTWQAPQHFIDRCALYVNTTHTNTNTLNAESYCALNLMLDEVIGNLTCALHTAGMYDNTLFVLVSDNGGVPTMSGNSWPFKGAKGSLYRGGESVAGFMYGSTSVIPAVSQGSSYDGVMHVTDWLPTLMNVATNGAWNGSYKGQHWTGWTTGSHFSPMAHRKDMKFCIFSTHMATSHTSIT